jgi:hypothetical protein
MSCSNSAWLKAKGSAFIEDLIFCSVQSGSKFMIATPIRMVTLHELSVGCDDRSSVVRGR